MGINKVILKILLYTLIITKSLSVALAAQTGRWVEYDLTGFGTGSFVGGTCPHVPRHPADVDICRARYKNVETVRV